jgi:hypothetical protein
MEPGSGFLWHHSRDIDRAFFDIVEDAEVRDPEPILGWRRLSQPLDASFAFERRIHRQHPADLLHDSSSMDRAQVFEIGDRLGRKPDLVRHRAAAITAATSA